MSWKETNTRDKTFTLGLNTSITAKDITTSGKNLCGYVRAPVHSQILCETRLVGQNSVRDIENKYGSLCKGRDNVFSVEGFSSSKSIIHLQVLAFNFIVLGLLYGYTNR